MRVGLPREVKDGEYRVALTPAGVRSLTGHGHEVIVEANAGAGVGFADLDYARAGARIAYGPDAPWHCELIVKVKELQPPEYARPVRGQTIFCFQHFGPEPELLDAALRSGASFVAYETVGQDDGSLPLLAPMSAIAGRLAVQIGAWCLQKHNGGSGVLLPGLDTVAPGHIVILGAGNAGANALAVAAGIGARVTVFARSERRIASLRARYTQRVTFCTDPARIADAVAGADLVIGAVLSPGQMSPKLITRAMLRTMLNGSALVDVGIDQGGIAETSRPTTHSAPLYVEEGVIHYCVPNMPSACARTASLALEGAVLPYVLALGGASLRDAIAQRPELASGVQVTHGRLTHAFLARDTGRSCVTLDEVLQ